MHPADVAAASRAGATGHFADRKYGWPRKAYFENIPNPQAGMLESRRSCSHPAQAEIDAGKWVRVPTGQFSRSTGAPTFSWHDAGNPAAPTIYGKFYRVHLQDAAPEDRATIEKLLVIAFEFTPEGSVSWRPAQ